MKIYGHIDLIYFDNWRESPELYPLCYNTYEEVEEYEIIVSILEAKKVDNGEYKCKKEGEVTIGDIYFLNDLQEWVEITKIIE